MQRHAVVLSLVLCWSVSWAGRYDYWECISPDGHVSHSVDRCPRGDDARRIEDNIHPVSFNLGEGVDPRIRLLSSRGHFYATARINGVPLRVMVDTGASMVALSPSAAARTGLDRRPFRPGWTDTANGLARARYLTAESVELGGHVVRNVPASILSQNMVGQDALLGMSFLRHFEINLTDSEMTLRRK